MINIPKIKSMYAVLDVLRGRKALEKLFGTHPGLRVPITIHGFIAGPEGHDDGTSIEFGVIVTTIDVPNEVKEP